MKHCLRIGLALVIAIGFLMANGLLSPDSASAFIKQPKVKVNSAGVRIDANIHPPNQGIEKANEVAGEIKGRFSPGESATAQFADSSLSLLGTQLLDTGAGSTAVSVAQTGPESFRVEGRSIVNNINWLDGAVTADRGETRLICDMVSGNVTCPVQSATFEN
jgi:hypothetical protein